MDLTPFTFLGILMIIVIILSILRGIASCLLRLVAVFVSILVLAWFIQTYIALLVGS